MLDKIKLIETKYPTLLKTYGIDTILRRAHFFGQLMAESNLVIQKENLNYTAKRLCEIFPKYFKSLEEAKLVYGKPASIANKVYANRMGNGNEASGDGYKFRGRSYIMITGRENYAKLAEATGIDCINNPDLLLEETNALISSLWFWKKNNCNALADKDDVVGLTKKINGGSNGIEHRKEYTNQLKTTLK